MNNLQEEEMHLKLLASIIEYRCNNLIRTKLLLSKDLDNLYKSKYKRSQDKICLNISIKLDYIEILLSKIIDDIMLTEIIECDKIDAIAGLPQKDDGVLYQ